MYFGAKQLPLNASFMSAPNHMWLYLENIFLEQLQINASDGYIHDEETILSGVIDKYPEKFSVIGRPLRGLRRAPLILNKGMETLRTASRRFR